MRLKTASAALGVTMLTAMPHAWAQQPAGGEFPVNSFTPGHQAYPSVASDRDGNFVVVWDDGTVKGQRFGDVPASNPFCKWIEELARRGVVSGCGGGNYCPTQPVTREQMGAFITVSFGLTIYGP
jgi:S-layer family protein